MSKYSSAPSGRELSLYGLAGGGQVFGYSLIVGYLSYYSINVLLIDPKTVGLLLLVQGLWECGEQPACRASVRPAAGEGKSPSGFTKMYGSIVCLYGIAFQWRVFAAGHQRRNRREGLVSCRGLVSLGDFIYHNRCRVLVLICYGFRCTGGSACRAKACCFFPDDRRQFPCVAGAARLGRLTAEEEQKMQDELKTRRKTRGAAEETQPGLL